MAATASGQTRERLTKMTLFGYYNPMGHTHATLRSTSSAFEQEAGKLVVALPKYGRSGIRTNEKIRRLLLEKAGFAVVLFQAFGLLLETGWFRYRSVAFRRVTFMLDSTAFAPRFVGCDPFSGGRRVAAPVSLAVHRR